LHLNREVLDKLRRELNRTGETAQNWQKSVKEFRLQRVGFPRYACYLVNLVLKKLSLLSARRAQS